MRQLLTINLVLFPFLASAQIDSAIFQSNVMNAVMGFNTKIDKLSDALHTARANKSVDTVKIGDQRRDTVKKCFQVPQDFIKGYPTSPLCIEALEMLGEGEERSPVQLSDLERLFAGLNGEVKNSVAGIAYTEKLVSLGWLNKIRKQLNNPILSGSISSSAAKQALRDVAGEKVLIKNPEPLDALLDDADIKHQITPSVLIVNMAYKKGNDQKVNTATAYVIDESGICITNYHVLREYSSKAIYTSLSVMNAEGEVYPVTALLSSSESDDLVIFKVDIRGHKFKALPLSDNAERMRPVYVLGHPMQNFYRFTSGTVVENQDETFFGKPCLLMSITAEFTVGSSGGPIVDGAGNVVGTVSRKSEDGKVKTGIPVSELKKLIEFKK